MELGIAKPDGFQFSEKSLPKIVAHNDLSPIIFVSGKIDTTKVEGSRWLLSELAVNWRLDEVDMIGIKLVPFLKSWMRLCNERLFAVEARLVPWLSLTRYVVNFLHVLNLYYTTAYKTQDHA